MRRNVNRKVDNDRKNVSATTAQVAMELAKYNIDIAAICETRFSESGSLNDMNDFTYIAHAQKHQSENL